MLIQTVWIIAFWMVWCVHYFITPIVKDMHRSSALLDPKLQNIWSFLKRDFLKRALFYQKRKFSWPSCVWLAKYSLKAFISHPSVAPFQRYFAQEIYTFDPIRAIFEHPPPCHKVTNPERTTSETWMRILESIFCWSMHIL